MHVILRGGTKGPNYAAEHVKAAASAIEKARPQHHPSIMIDCSRPSPPLPLPAHFTDTLRFADGNSEKNHNNQPKVLASICAQLAAGDRTITGVMVESHINAGRQDVPPEGPGALKHGVSITDACVDWATTVKMMDELNAAVGSRREKVLQNGLRK